MYAEKWGPEEAPLEDNVELGGGKKKKYLSRNIAPFQDLPFAEPMDSSWSFTAAEGDEVLYEGRADDDPDWNRYRNAHIYFDPDMSEQKGGYKLPIAKMSGGSLKVYLRGCLLYTSPSPRD